MPGVKVHNVPAEWLEALADIYDAEADYLYSDGETSLGDFCQDKADEVRRYIAEQGEHNA